MIRCRFYVAGRDYRPVKWPVKHPYWCTGHSLSCLDDGGYKAVVVSYADNEEYILEFWPDAEDINSENVNDYNFTSRFPKPKWWDTHGSAVMQEHEPLGRSKGE